MPIFPMQPMMRRQLHPITAQAAYWWRACAGIAGVATLLVVLATPPNAPATAAITDDLCAEYSGLPPGFGPDIARDQSRAGMVVIRGGHFRMGSEQGYPEEREKHDVTVGAFWIDRHEVTNAQFAQFVAATGYVSVAERTPDNTLAADLPAEMRGPGSILFYPPEPDGRTEVQAYTWWRFAPGAHWQAPGGAGTSIKGRSNHPVVHIALEDAMAYARWLGRDLPTEAEWEFAARGGLDGRSYPWGDDPRPQGRWQANTWQGPYPLQDAGADGHKGTAPVGCFAPNDYGLVDMVGNVWEWTRDRYRSRHPNTPEHNPMVVRVQSTADDSLPPEARVIKGGSFLCSPDFCLRYRPSARQPQDPTLSTLHLGFRTVLRDKTPAHSE